MSDTVELLGGHAFMNPRTKASKSDTMSAGPTPASRRGFPTLEWSTNGRQGGHGAAVDALHEDDITRTLCEDYSEFP